MTDIIADLNTLPAQVILDTLNELELLGEKKFLSTYPPYHPAKNHIGIYNDLRFPPRAVLAAAYSKVHGRIPEPQEGPRKLSGEQLKVIFGKHGIEVVQEYVEKNILRLTDRKAVLLAIQEFDLLGRDEFLAKYGYGKAKSYFIYFNGRAYDSKAIAGVARGYEFPEIGPLTLDQFSGGKSRVVPQLERLGFNILEKKSGDLETPLVLVQSDRTAGSKFDDYGDLTGEEYHYPNKYRNQIKEGRRFVYYRGVRTAEGPRRIPEYFGCGVIGDVYEDPETLGKEPKNRKWICKISNYSPFTQTVPFKLNDQPIEDIPQNLFGVGVREVSELVYEQILKYAGQKQTQSASGKVAGPVLPHLDEVNAEGALKGLLRPTNPTSKKGFGGSGAGSRHSSYSKVLGDRGEEIVLNHLRHLLPEKEAASLKWSAQEGEKNGWDLEYKSNGRLIGVEVKATGGSYFQSIELTANEWRAAEEKRSDYRLALVSDVKSKKPQIEFIEDPFGSVTNGGFEVEPLSWRFVKCED